MSDEKLDSFKCWAIEFIYLRYQIVQRLHFSTSICLFRKLIGSFQYFDSCTLFTTMKRLSIIQAKLVMKFCQITCRIYEWINSKIRFKCLKLEILVRLHISILNSKKQHIKTLLLDLDLNLIVHLFVKGFVHQL